MVDLKSFSKLPGTIDAVSHQSTKADSDIEVSKMDQSSNVGVNSATPVSVASPNASSNVAVDT
jgi:hypothetical protein